MLERVVSERLIARIDFSSWIQESFIVSPDNKRVAYVAEEGKQYVSIVTIAGGGIIFDSPDSLHYLAIKEDGGLYLVEEKIK
ncbi:MAG: hypothetical protein ACUZ77_00835 [Candidatus Brocadiales bacterium]